MNDYDYVIVGSGIAGLYTALLAQQHGSVALITKHSVEECNTKYAQGGIAAALGPDDTPELHYRDTMAAGAGLCDPKPVRILAEEAADRIADLIRYGVPFDTVDGSIALTKEAAHSVSRILHAGGDATGEQIEISLSNVARLAKGIKILEYCLATRIITEGGRVAGLEVLDARSGWRIEFSCRFLILATGGAGRLYKITTNPDIATGDGVALAYEAGAEIADMEFFQFHPTALRLPGVAPFLISEAVRGEGAVLRNSAGERFMQRYDPKGELAPRDIVARGVVSEMRGTRADHVLLDVTHLSPAKVTARFPQIYRFCLDQGLDITKRPIPVAPAAHYMMGGVRTNVWGETNVSNLFACGETACTGVHGANRLASNSLLEVLIFGKRIIERTSRSLPPEALARDAGKFLYTSLPQAEKCATSRGKRTAASLTALQDLMWDDVGIMRSGESLRRARGRLARWETDIPTPTDRASYELANAIRVARIMTEAALMREESRGAHFRSDFPEQDERWLKRIVFLTGE